MVQKLFVKQKTVNYVRRFQNRNEIAKCGFPQGFIPGLLFFLIFVNDLNSSTKVLDPVPFANNTDLFCSDSDIRTVFEIANKKLGQISDWLLVNKLSLNVEKTKYMLFCKLTDQENIPSKLPPLQLNGNIIKRENFLKFLGVIREEHLTWRKTYIVY